jgi:integrase
MRVTKTEDPEMLAYVCIGLSAGLRRSELCALEWPEIDLQVRQIEVKDVK